MQQIIGSVLAVRVLNGRVEGQGPYLRAALYQATVACWAVGWQTCSPWGGGGAEDPRLADRAAARAIVVPLRASSTGTSRDVLA